MGDKTTTETKPKTLGSTASIAKTAFDLKEARKKAKKKHQNSSTT